MTTFKCNQCGKQIISLSGAHLLCLNCFNCWSDSVDKLNEFAEFGVEGDITINNET